MTSLNLRAILCIGLAIVALLVILGTLKDCSLGVSQPASEIKMGKPIITELVIDTVTVVKTDTVKVQRIATRVIWRDRKIVAQIDSTNGDTLLLAQPFTAAFDTVADGARISGKLSFPPLRLGLLQVEVPDSLKTITKRTYIDRVVEIKTHDPWYIEGLRDASFFLAGYATRMILEPRDVTIMEGAQARPSAGTWTVPAYPKASVTLTLAF